jgi:hypothetical protein
MKNADTTIVAAAMQAKAMMVHEMMIVTETTREVWYSLGRTRSNSG